MSFLKWHKKQVEKNLNMFGLSNYQGLWVSFIKGLIFGALTTLAPLLILLPFTGQGIFAKNTGIPIKTSLMFLIRHSIYGISMYEGFRWFT